MDKMKLKEREAQIIALAEGFCREKLDEECGELCAKLIKKLGRKRLNPLQSGKVEVWAAGAVHAIGTINFLFDKASPVNMTPTDISDYFDASKSTISQKSKLIRDTLGLTAFDAEFSLANVAAENPFNNIVMVNGFYFLK